MTSPLLPDDPETLAPGTLIDSRYRVERVLGRGGFAVVYQVQHLRLEQPAALKVLDLHGSSRDVAMFRERFEREAKLAARLEHPNVVKVFDYGFVEQNRQPYLAMELLRGHDLEHELRSSGPLEPERAKRLFLGALEALELAHERGIVHKDLKPSNLFLRDAGHPERERLVVLDYGIARVFDDEGSRLTQTNQFAGTPAYIAPEYIERHEVSPAFDVYQMGLILGESLLGTPLIEADSTLGYMMAHCEGRHQLNPQFAQTPLGQVIQRAIAVDPGQRYAHAGQLRAAVQQVPWQVLPEHRVRPLGPASSITQPEVRPGYRTTQPPQQAPPIPAAASYAALPDASAVAWAQPQAAPARRSRLGLWLALGLVGASVLGATAIAAALLIAKPQAPSTTTTTTSGVAAPQPSTGLMDALSTRAPTWTTGQQPSTRYAKLGGLFLGMQFTYGPLAHMVTMHDSFVTMYTWQKPEVVAASAPRHMPDNFKHGLMHTRAACASGPSMPSLDEACPAYIAQVEELALLFEDFDVYYHIEQGHLRDHGERGRALHQKLMRQWGVYESASRAVWDALHEHAHRALTAHRDDLRGDERLVHEPLIGAIQELWPVIDALRDEPGSPQAQARLDALEAQVRALRQVLRQVPAPTGLAVYTGPDTHLNKLNDFIKVAREAHQDEAKHASEPEAKRRMERSSRMSMVLLHYFQLMMHYLKHP